VGGLAGGSADAGAGTPTGGLDSGAISAGDAGTQSPGTALDGGVPDAAIDSGLVPDAGDAGCPQPLPPDASVCPNYGCRSTREQLRAAMNPQGACSSEQAVALACDGRVGKAALQCTEESVFTLNLERAVTTCLKRDAAIAQLSSGCLECFVDEALCTLSRCFALCALASENDECRSCRRQQCGTTLSQCTGLPAP
jgi:hypothetical protein